jgi:dipeptidyl aminopeptidase/acylaminoacyl peptidase
MLCLNCFREIPDNSRGCRLCGVNFDQWAAGKSSPKAKAKAREQKGARGRISKPAHPQRARDDDDDEVQARPRRSWKRRLAILPALGVLGWLGWWAAGPAMDQIASRGTLVFVSSQDRQLYALRPGSAPLRLGGPVNGTRPSVSRDGRKVVFVSDRDGGRGLDVIGIDGAGLTRLPLPGPEPGQPAWSPDGGRLAFACRPANPPPAAAEAPLEPAPRLPNEVFVVSADGTRLVNVSQDAVADDSQPAWSPGGTKLAFVSTRGGGGIYTVMADGNGLAPLALGVGGAHSPAWSPDGGRIAFLSPEGDVYVAAADGSQARRLTNAQSEGRSHLQATWSPDGERLAALRLRRGGTAYEMSILRADGGGVEQVVPAEDGGLTWSSADHVVFIGRPEAGRSWFSIRAYSGAPQVCLRSVRRGARRWTGLLEGLTSFVLTQIARTPPVDPATTILTESGALAADWAPGSP